jgi:hypothetical protein
MSALAVDSWNFENEFFWFDVTLDGVDAFGGRAPFQVLLVINIGPCQKFAVSNTRISPGFDSKDSRDLPLLEF